MATVLIVLCTMLRDILRRRTDLEAELLALRHQILVYRREGQRRVQLRSTDRAFWVVLSRLWPRWREALHMLKPETVIAWHRRGLRWYWQRKSRPRRSGRPALRRAVIDLIRSMHQANPLWGAPRIHGELIKLGIEVASRRCRNTCHACRAKRRPRGGRHFSAIISRR